jgi:purine-nucleoside phosphorylase
MDHLVGELEQAAHAWDARGWPRPQVVVVSGSGLAVDLGPGLVPALALAELLPFPIHAVPGHPHRVELLAPRADRVALYLRGRLHAYQGYTAAQLVFPLRLAALLGARVVLMTNAAGGLNPDYRPGDLVAIADHLNLSGANPLCGEPPAGWGARFPDLAEAYAPRLRALAAEHAGRLGFALASGVYAGLLGPSYETPAEVRMFRTLGADLAGMSTVLEVIAARHLGLECCCFSLVTNLAAGVGPPLSHDEVLAAGDAAAARVQGLLTALLADSRLLADPAVIAGSAHGA